ncbi:MAG: HPr family phosphocarrier protein, partial [Halanaerobium sp.]
MLSKNKVKIKNKTGLHARPAAQFVQKASNFDSEI